MPAVDYIFNDAKFKGWNLVPGEKGLESIKQPTLLMTGDGDLYLPPSLLRMQASHMPQAEVVIIPEAGHNANWEQPEIFNKTVLAFIAKMDGDYEKSQLLMALLKHPVDPNEFLKAINVSGSYEHSQVLKSLIAVRKLQRLLA